MQSLTGVHSKQYAGETWTCDPEVPDATDIRVSFTGERESADDVLQMAQSWSCSPYAFR